jgi:FkbM family methyltransferase
MSALFWTLQLDLHSYFVGYRFSDAEYAIYAVGCFELPLIGMLSEAVTSVLIPRMSEWQSQNRQSEMIELTTRAMKKLALVYFPLFIFLFITAYDFITTLFTDSYAASVPIFQINITLLPFMVLVTDPIVRAYQSLGRYLMKLRIITFIFLVTALWFGIQYLNMAGMITIVVIISLLERFFLTRKVAKTVGFNRNDFYLLRNVVKIALAAVVAGAVLFTFYWFFGETVRTSLLSGINWLLNSYANQKVITFIGRASFLAVCFLVFAPFYLLLVFMLDTLEKEEKQWFLNLLNFQRFFRKPKQLAKESPSSPDFCLGDDIKKMFTTKLYENLVYDVGLNQGEDTEFYLKKGFKVIAFEANPDSAEFCRKKFADAVERGDLVIVEGAIVDHQNQLNGHSTTKFYRNVDHRLWGSASEDFALRSEVLGTTNEVIEVKVTDFTECLKKYGIPYYLKADITGSETVCLRALLNFENKPRYISIRSEKVIFRRLEEEINILEKLGYNKFMAIQQDVENLQVPAHSKEGLSVPHIFPEGSSGLFGQDLPEKWKEKEAILKDYRRIFVFYWLFGDYSYLRQTAKGNKFITKMERLFRQPLPGWYDTHAKHSSLL